MELPFAAVRVLADADVALDDEVCQLMAIDGGSSPPKNVTAPPVLLYRWRSAAPYRRRRR